MRVGFIGLGVMGASMARRLLRAGHELRVSTRSPAKAADLIAEGAVWADTPARLAPECEVIFTMLGLPADVEDVYYGPDGLIARADPGILLIDCTTSSPALAARIATAAAARGLRALDAPVTGGDVGARDGTLAMLVGGEESDLERALPLLRELGKNIVFQGRPGSGQKAKLCNQVAIAGTMVGVCEAMAFAEHAGLDPETVLHGISAGAAGSWAMTKLAPRMLAADFAPGFFVKHFIKDLTLAREAAAEIGLELPGLALTLARYHALAECGGGEQGTQALIRLYRA